MYFKYHMYVSSNKGHNLHEVEEVHPKSECLSVDLQIVLVV